MKLFRAITAALLLGAATLAVAQTRAESFADQFKQMQTLQSFGTYTFKPPPTFGNKHADPSGKESLTSMVSRMQALQSFGTYTFKPPPTFSSEPADPVGKESFASMFSRMQAGSSNSDEWKLPPSDGAPTYATASGATVASESGKPTLAERIARALHVRGSGSSQSN